jgi:hypothetical protein
MLYQTLQVSLRSPYSSPEDIVISSSTASDLRASCALVTPLSDKARRRKAIDLRETRDPNMVAVDYLTPFFANCETTVLGLGSVSSLSTAPISNGALVFLQNRNEHKQLRR